MTSKVLFVSSVLCLILPMIGCKNHDTAKDLPDSMIRKSGDTVYVASGSEISGKLTIKEIDTALFNSRYTTTGVVRPLTGQLAEITSPFEGRVVNSFIRLGEKISKGAPVFGISSSDYLDAIKSYRQSSKEKELAEKNLKRKKELYEQGIIPVKELDESNLALEMAEKEFARDEAVIKVFNSDPESVDFAHPLIIRSPIAGEVVRNDITIGQFVSAGSQPQIIVANLEKVWVVAHVKEKDLGAISEKDQVEITTESHPEGPLKGTVEYVGGLMEDETRSVEVFIECRNIDHLLKPGMFVTVNSYHAENASIIIPATAVLQEDDYSFTYEQVAPGTFVMRKVKVSSVDPKTLLVTSGLKHGQKIVAEGGIYLR
jgi:membrane fusion protein, heavy metal efflux system